MLKKYIQEIKEDFNTLYPQNKLILEERNKDKTLEEYKKDKILEEYNNKTLKERNNKESSYKSSLNLKRLIIIILAYKGIKLNKKIPIRLQYTNNYKFN